MPIAIAVLIALNLATSLFMKNAAITPKIISFVDEKPIKSDEILLEINIAGNVTTLIPTAIEAMKMLKSK